MSAKKRSRQITLAIIGASSLFSLGGCSKAPPDIKQTVYSTKQDCLAHWGHVANSCQLAGGQYAGKGYYASPQFDANGEKPKGNQGVVATVAPALLAGAAVAAAAGAAAAMAQQQQQPSGSSTSAYVSRSGSSSAPTASAAAPSGSTHGGFGAHSSSSSSGG
jgi:hypothetical protein